MANFESNFIWEIERTFPKKIVDGISEDVKELLLEKIFNETTSATSKDYSRTFSFIREREDVKVNVTVKIFFSNEDGFSVTADSVASDGSYTLAGYMYEKNCDGNNPVGEVIKKMNDGVSFVDWIYSNIEMHLESLFDDFESKKELTA